MQGLSFFLSLGTAKKMSIRKASKNLTPGKWGKHWPKKIASYIGRS